MTVTVDGETKQAKGPLAATRGASRRKDNKEYAVRNGDVMMLGCMGRTGKEKPQGRKRVNRMAKTPGRCRLKTR